MGFLTVKSNDMAFHSLGAEHRTERQIHALQNRTLFDMEFQIRSGVFLFLLCLGESVDLHPATAQCVLEFHAVLVRAKAIRSDRMRTCKCGRTEQAAAKPRALLVGPINQTHRERRMPGIFRGDAPQNLESGENVQYTVKPSAVRDRIEMTAEQQGL